MFTAVMRWWCHSNSAIIAIREPPKRKVQFHFYGRGMKLIFKDDGSCHRHQWTSRSKLEQYPNRFVIFRVAQREIISNVSGFGLLKNGQMVLKTRLNVSLPAAKVRGNWKQLFLPFSAASESAWKSACSSHVFRLPQQKVKAEPGLVKFYCLTN